jgi:hypothetical protein
MTGAQVELQEAARFLRILDPEAESWHFRAIRGESTRAFRGPLESCVQSLTELNGEGWNTFCVVNESTGFADKDVLRIRAVFADFDGTPLPASFELEPHAIVNTSPGKWHVYWLVDGLHVEQFTPVQQAIAAKYGTDDSVVNPARLMRVPGFLHCKGEPFRSRIHHESGGIPYSAEEIEAAFPQAPRVVTDGCDSATTPVIGAQIPEGARDNTLTSLAGTMRKRGMGEAAIEAALIAENAEKCSPPLPVAQVKKIARSIAKKPAGAQFIATAAGIPTVRSAAELMTRDFAPVQWAIRDIIPEGISILSGDPKIGKSWLVYQAGFAIATGSALWPGRDPETQGDVLLLALEDNDRRMQRRLEILHPHFAPMRVNGHKISAASLSLDRLHYTTEWPRAEPGVAAIAEWLRQHPACRLVAIDTIGAFRDPDPGRKSAYQHDYAVGEMLKPLAREFSTAIVLVSHNRKMKSDDPLQAITGTQGLTGGVDNLLVLQRERGKMDAGLYVDGRDIENAQELAMNFRAGFWSSDGRSVDEAQISTERERVFAAIAALGSGQSKARAIADQLYPQKFGAVKKLLSVMVKDGQLKNVDGLYVSTHIR